jgi:chromosome partitioning related protein ParA
MKIISVISTKGGVGKTTLVANLAGYLSSIGKSVLMIDADPRPSLSSYYKIEQKAEGGLIDFLSNSNQSDNYISKIPYHNCDLVYSSDSNNQL